MFLKLLIYLLLSSLVFGSFYGFYKNVFYKLAYFQWNRFYLLFSLFAGALLPVLWPEVIKFKINIAENNTHDWVHDLNQIYFFTERSATKFWPSLQFIHILYSIYLAGFLVRIIAFVFRLVEIKTNTKGTKKETIFETTIYWKQEISDHFTFGRKIYVNPDFFKLSKTNQESILLHEKVHAKHWHTLDNFLAELFKITFWVIPFVKKLQKAIIENHEYIADNIAGENGSDNAYSHLLLDSAIRKQNNTLKHYFASSMLKNRLLVLAKPERELIRKKRFRIAVPVVIILAMALAFISGIVRGMISTKSDTENYFPVERPFEIVQYYYKNKPVALSGETLISATHESVAISVPDYTPVHAIATGFVSKVYKYNNWGVDEYGIILVHNDYTSQYYGLYAATVNKDQIITQNETIGFTGDNRLYPYFRFQIFKNNEFIDPLSIY